jgi:hypothetical protein
MAAAVGPGSRVKCINKDNWYMSNGGRFYAINGPGLDQICVVEAVVTRDTEGYFLLHFNDVFEGKRISYDAKSFIPIDEDGTDISVFTKILDKVNSRENENV